MRSLRHLIVLLLFLVPAARPVAAQPVAPGFTIETYATSSGPESLSFDAAGNLFVGRGVPGGTGVEYGEAAIPDPDGVLVDLDGSISGTAGAVLVCGDALGNDGQIVAVLPNESIATVHAASGVLANPNYMRRGRDGLLLSDSQNTAIYEFAPPGPPAVLVPSPAGPSHLAVDDLDRIYVSHADGVVRQYDADGAVLDADYVNGFGSAPIAVGPGGLFGTDLYLVSPTTGELRRVFSDGTSAVLGTGFPASVAGMEFGPDGALYISVFDTGEILRIAPAGLDGFLCYKAKPTKQGDAFEAPPDLALVDAFESRETDVLRPKALCNPADLAADGITDDATHLESYQIKSSEKHEKVKGFPVSNRFGSLALDTSKEDRLLVPSAKGLVKPPGPLGTSFVDHFKCYKAKTSKGTPKFPKGVQVTVADQFDGTARTFDVKKPKHLCLPVDKNGEGIQRPDDLLVCYQAKPAKGQPKHAKRLGVRTLNQFGTEQLDTVKEEELCVPSLQGPGEG